MAKPAKGKTAKGPVGRRYTLETLVLMCERQIKRWAKLSPNDPRSKDLEAKLAAHAPPGIYVAWLGDGRTGRFRVYGLSINDYVPRGPGAVLVEFEPFEVEGGIPRLIPLLMFRRAVQRGGRQFPAFHRTGDLPPVQSGA